LYNVTQALACSKSMPSAAFGIRAHSGWAAVVAISGKPGSVRLLDRRRIAVTDPQTPGANQPYHFVEEFELPAAEKHLTNCATVGERFALAALSKVVRELRQYEVAGAAILLASGRPLPSLDKILASHALIHTAEGQFFRDIFRQACGRLKIPVVGIRERDLNAAPAVQQEIAALGKSMGPPWTQDQKLSALAALTVLSQVRMVADAQ
jgi:hypothetical protein